jgi:hypothetical protein
MMYSLDTFQNKCEWIDTSTITLVKQDDDRDGSDSITSILLHNVHVLLTWI